MYLIRHMQDLKRAEADTGGATSDPDAVKKLILHYHDHILQLQQKKLQQAVVEQAVGAVAEMMKQGGGPLAMPRGLFGGPPSIPPGDRQAVGPFPFSDHPEVQHEQ